MYICLALKRSGQSVPYSIIHSFASTKLNLIKNQPASLLQLPHQTASSTNISMGLKSGCIQKQREEIIMGCL